MRSFDDYVAAGAGHDVMKALELLTRAYVSQCGLSLGCRTVVYCAAESWQLKLAFLDLPLSEMARKKPLFLIMPHISECYDPEVHDEYDICGMNNDELMSSCHDILISGEFDEATNEVLCWGISEACRNERFIPRPISTVAEDGTLLSGILRNQSLGWTSVEMTAPYAMHGHRHELVKDPERILETMYSERMKLQSMEKKIKSLYEDYRTRFLKIATEKETLKYSLFYDVYEPLIGDTSILSPQDLFYEWFGLEFYDIYSGKDPSWVTK